MAEQVEEKISKNQRKFLLNEQLKQIKQELGLEKDEKEGIIERFRARLEGVDLPENAEQVQAPPPNPDTPPAAPGMPCRARNGAGKPSCS